MYLMRAIRLRCGDVRSTVGLYERALDDKIAIIRSSAPARFAFRFVGFPTRDPKRFRRDRLAELSWSRVFIRPDFCGGRFKRVTNVLKRHGSRSSVLIGSGVSRAEVE